MQIESYAMSTPPREPPIGQRFSQVYIERGEPAGDSKRMRLRLQEIVYALPKEVRDCVIAAVPRRLGVPWHSYASFFGEAAIRDVLDLVTITFRCAAEAGYVPSGTARRWLEEGRQIFAEENLHYRFDDAGGAHFSFDKEFNFNVAYAIAALTSPRYENARREFELGQTALSQTPPDGKGGIRGTFTAAEGIFKLMFPNVPRLTAKEADQLKPVLQKVCAEDAAALGASGKLLNSLKEWVDAAHFYRHEPRSENVAQPPLPLAIQLISVGAANVRWLAELDQLR